MPDFVVIDDESEIRDILAEVLESQGHKVFKAAGGKEGVEIIRRVRPDLVLLDLKMPGMDGYQVLEVIRGDEDLRSIPVIILTALKMPKQVIDGLRKGANDYITKPFNMDELLARTDVQIGIQRLERQVRDSEARYRTLFERSADPTVLLDEEGSILQVNSAAANLLESDKNELLGTRVLNLVSPSGRPEFESALVGALEGSKIPIYESHLVLQTGKLLPVDIELHPIDILESHHLLLQLRDLRWRKASQIWANMLLKYIGDAVFITDGRGIILQASNSTADLTGYAQREIVGLDIARLLSVESLRKWRKEFFPDLRGGESRVFEGLICQKNRNIIAVEWVMALFLVDDEEYLIGVARDVTVRRKQNEMAAIRAT